MPDINFESVPQPEKIPEPESAVGVVADISKEVPRTTGESGEPIVPQPAASASLPRKEPQILEIEGILSEGLDDAYLSLTEDKRREFRLKGETTARSIDNLLSHGKATLNKIRSLIMKWLKLIPGVNRYFLEQEAKIKADKIWENRVK